MKNFIKILKTIIILYKFIVKYRNSKKLTLVQNTKVGYNIRRIGEKVENNLLFRINFCIFLEWKEIKKGMLIKYGKKRKDQ